MAGCFNHTKIGSLSDIRSGGLRERVRERCQRNSFPLFPNFLTHIPYDRDIPGFWLLSPSEMIPGAGAIRINNWEPGGGWVGEQSD